jgi:hypothetical protein
VRESHATVAGPRSRTLATFRTLTSEIVERAIARSSKSLNPSDLRKAALRVGAPIASSAADRATGELLAELAATHRPRPVLRRLLLDALAPEHRKASDSARAAARWATTTPQERGETLRDLLLLADRLPPSRSPSSQRCPRLRSMPA